MLTVLRVGIPADNFNTREQGCSHHLRVAQTFLSVEGEGKVSCKYAQIHKNADLRRFTQMKQIYTDERKEIKYTG